MITTKRFHLGVRGQGGGGRSRSRIDPWKGGDSGLGGQEKGGGHGVGGVWSGVSPMTTRT